MKYLWVLFWSFFITPEAFILSSSDEAIILPEYIVIVIPSNDSKLCNIFILSSSNFESFFPNTKLYLAHIPSSFEYIINLPDNIVISLLDRKASSAVFNENSPE